MEDTPDSRSEMGRDGERRKGFEPCWDAPCAFMCACLLICVRPHVLLSTRLFARGIYHADRS